MWLLYHIQEDHHVKMTKYDFGHFIQMAAEKQKRQERDTQSPLFALSMAT